nr:immunoglobulin light chain junction region [Macaca mulatta]MOV72825.1 immunoglobulin light chain junction region [Macaca mulatta]MOV73709.1 immunoglobulin light chain junction region [Macaca mulatta]MOV74087.1 immunoglobulin light chain junction region [Macaca mulatta]
DYFCSVWDSSLSSYIF